MRRSKVFNLSDFASGLWALIARPRLGAGVAASVDSSFHLPYTHTMFLGPLALSILLLVFWAGLGWSLIAAVEPGMEPLKAMLIAPAVGVALTLLPAFWLNAFGLPVSVFARPLTVVLGTIGVVTWGWRRPSWNPRDLLFVVVVLLGLVLVGFPTLRFGFDWIGNANDDWGNYNLRAIRFLNSGFYQQPSIEAMREGRNYPGFYWFVDVAGGVRPGSDMLLAWLSAVVGKSPFFVFMPLILAFHGALCFAVASLALSSFKSRIALLGALLMTAVAPLSLYAVHQQLIAQVIGLGFTCAMASLTFVPLHQLKSRGRVAITAILSSGYLLLYPELVPFFALAFGLFHASHSLEKDWGWKQSWRVLGVPAIAFLLLGPYSIDAVLYLFSQFHGSATQGINNGISIFPYFSVPSGLAVLSGFSRLGELLKEPWLSLSIAAGLLSLAVVLFGMLVGLASRQNIAFFVTGMLLVVMMVAQRSDFGVFKIAMFAQAFIWFSIVTVLARFRLRLAIPAYLVIFSMLIFTDIRSLRSSLQDGLGIGNSIQNSSHGKLLSRLLIDRSMAACDIDFDTLLPPLIKILSATPGCARTFVARPALFSGRAVAAARNDPNPLHKVFQIPEFVERAAARLRPISIQLPLKYLPLGGNPVVISKPPVEYSKIAADVDSQSVFNTVGINGQDMNRLMFVESNLGSHYYLPESGIVSIYATEADSFFPGGKFAAAGHYLLFRIGSPSKSVRLELDLTTSILGDGEARLPPATVVGEDPVLVGLAGHGAARVISPPLSPLIVDGVAYILLDLAAEPKPIAIPRPGLMGLYGTKVPIDPRQMVAFVRQIRLIDANAQTMAVLPSEIHNFPVDLANKNLEFSGIYEDGWLGDEGFVALSSDRPGMVVFRGLFPNGLGLDSVDLTLKVTAGEPTVKHLLPGPFEVVLPAEKGRSRIDFKFSAVGRLPSGDNRPASALLSSVSIESDGRKPPENPQSEATHDRK